MRTIIIITLLALSGCAGVYTYEGELVEHHASFYEINEQRKEVAPHYYYPVYGFQVMRGGVCHIYVTEEGSPVYTDTSFERVREHEIRHCSGWEHD